MLCSNTTRVLNRITKYKVGFFLKKKKATKREQMQKLTRSGRKTAANLIMIDWFTSSAKISKVSNKENEN